MKLLQLAIAVVFFAGSASASPAQITGAGATFPYPLYSKWFYEFHRFDPDGQINYQSIGSGGGIRQFLDETIDFGASDAPMTEQQLAKAAIQVVHIPTVLGAIVLTYNLPHAGERLRLSAGVIADIFLGKIEKWNDARIVKENPDGKLPDAPILVAHRSDGSGTTQIFTDYLSKVSPEWKQKVGAGTAVNWPVGLGGKGNEGVTGLVKQSPGTIGYVELIYAANNKLPMASLKNKAGRWVEPSPRTVTAAAEGSLKTIPDDFRVSITDAAGAAAYPVCGFTYLLVPEDLRRMGPKGKEFAKFLKWAMREGQGYAAPLAYAPLPEALVRRVDAKVASMRTE